MLTWYISTVFIGAVIVWAVYLAKRKRNGHR